MSYQNTEVRTCCSREMEQTSRLGVKRGCWQLQHLGSRTENRITGLRDEPGEFQEALSEKLDGYLDISPWLDTMYAGRGKWAHSRLAEPSLSTCFWHCPSQVGICTTEHGGIGRQPLGGAFRPDTLHCSCCIGPIRPGYSPLTSATPGIFILRWDPQHSKNKFLLSVLTGTTLSAYDTQSLRCWAPAQDSLSPQSRTGKPWGTEPALLLHADEEDKGNTFLHPQELSSLCEELHHFADELQPSLQGHLIGRADADWEERGLLSGSHSAAS